MVTTANQCQARTKTGAPCQTPALHGSSYCFHHDPALASKRAAARAKGGHARHGRQLQAGTAHRKPVTLSSTEDILGLLEQAINDALSLENSLNRARTVGYLAMAAVKVFEVHDLEARLAALEEAYGKS